MEIKWKHRLSHVFAWLTRSHHYVPECSEELPHACSLNRRFWQFPDITQGGTWLANTALGQSQCSSCLLLHWLNVPHVRTFNSHRHLCWLTPPELWSCRTFSPSWISVGCSAAAWILAKDKSSHSSFSVWLLWLFVLSVMAWTCDHCHHPRREGFHFSVCVSWGVL